MPRCWRPRLWKTWVATAILVAVVDAAIALLLPVALSVAESQPSLEARGLVLAVTVAASLALWTPLGYQTNLRRRGTLLGGMRGPLQFFTGV